MTFTEYRQNDALALAKLVKEGAITAQELLDIAIARAEAVNDTINAIIHPLYALGKEMAAATPPSAPFAGVPFLLKDLSVNLAGYPLRKGSKGWSDYIPEQDDYFVQQLREAGFIFFGKTNTPELGVTPYTEPKLYGPTRNPWDLKRTAGGSSGGSAAAVAAGIVPMATASDGGGSIRIPASCNGLFGLKPSRGRISLGPHAGQAWAGAVVQGCVSRSVRDTAAYLDATSGHFPGDPFYLQQPTQPFLQEVGKPAGKLRIGFSTQHTLGHTMDTACVDAVQDAAKKLEELGHTVEEVTLPYPKTYLVESFLYVVLSETAASVRELEHHLGRKVKPGKDVEPTTYLQYLIGKTISGQEYAFQRRKWNTLAREMATFHEQYDFLLTSTAAHRPFEIGGIQPTESEKRLVHFVNTLKLSSMAAKNIDSLAEKIFDYIPYTAFCNMTGQPSMSVPLYWTDEGLPVGVMLSAPFGREDMCIRLASQLEQAHPWMARVPEEV
jgi:amidase